MQTSISTAGSVAPSTKDLPLLRRGADVVQGDGRVAIRYHRDEVTLEGAGAQLFARARPYLDGKTAVAAAATKLGESPARLSVLLEQLEKAGVLVFLSSQ